MGKPFHALAPATGFGENTALLEPSTSATMSEGIKKMALRDYHRWQVSSFSASGRQRVLDERQALQDRRSFFG